MADGVFWWCFSYFYGPWPCNLLGSQWDSHKPPGFHLNILNCVLKTNEAFTGSERHGGKWKNDKIFILGWSILKMLLTSNRCFWQNYDKIIFLQWKVILSESGEKYAQSSTIYSSKQIYWWILMWEDNREWPFSLEEVPLLIMNWYFGQKCIERFVSYKHVAFRFTKH